MAKYNVKFGKSGYMIYTSHLDMQRLFKRCFKRAGIDLSYSQGFNPHPLMSFAQPLSLGYYSGCEFIEFKTDTTYRPEYIKAELTEIMPKGLDILDCTMMDDGEKTLASRCVAAVYSIEIPADTLKCDAAKGITEKITGYLKQKEILAMKRKKKSKVPVEVDIKEKIKSMEGHIVDDKIIITTKLDAGSDSNLSPELVVQSFFNFLNIPLRRETIDITRLELICK